MFNGKLLALVLVTALLTAGCGGEGDQDQGSDSRVPIRLGYFPNITHAPAIVGLEEGLFEESLGADVELQTQTFNAGPQAIEAIFSDGLDATFIGPSPAINAYAKSNGEAVRVVSGATSGGAYLVVKPEVASAQDLRSKRVATPQAGNTQDVALRTWLTGQGVKVAGDGPPDVEILPQENSQTLETFRSGTIAGAWVPEPWASRLVLEAGGKVLVDERELWPEGKYATTLLIVRTEFLEEHPEVVEGLVKGLVAAIDFMGASPDEAKRSTGSAIGRITGRSLPAEVIDRAWNNLNFTVDPIASSLAKSAEDAAKLGFIEPVELGGLYELEALNKVLEAAGKPAVKAE